MNEYDLIIKGGEFWDQKNEEFIYTDEKKLKLKHSLLSVAKWECIWHKSFFNERVNDSLEETKSYVQCMTINGPFDKKVYDMITFRQLADIQKYIDDTMTGSTYHTFESNRRTHGGRGKKITAETIYYSMIQLGIPFECERWHLNRLIALIRFCEVSGGNNPKMSRDETLKMYAALNSKRKAKSRSKG